jgi:hypothetical protein
MSMTIGRSTLTRCDSAERDGALLRVGGTFTKTTMAAAVAERERLAGYVDNPDENAVPVTWTEDATLDGYYRVLSAAVELDKERSHETAGQFLHRWEASLERVPNAVIEEWSRFVLRANAHSVTAAGTRTFRGQPTGLWHDGFPSTGGEEDTLETADGAATLQTWFDTAVNTNLWADRTEQFYVAPANYYKASARILSSDEVVVGRHAEIAATAWEINNGIVQVKPSGTNARWNVASRDVGSDAWEALEFTVEGHSDPVQDLLAAPYRRAYVLRNSPECVALRLIAGFVIDVQLRRGSPFLECVISTSATQEFAVGRSATDAATSITGGIVDTTATAGNKWLLASPLAITKNVTEGSILSSSAVSKFPFAIGMTVSGGRSSDTGEPWDEANITSYYFQAGATRQHVVSA